MDNLLESFKLAFFQTQKILFKNFKFSKWAAYGLLSLIVFGNIPSPNISISPDKPVQSILAFLAVFTIITIVSLLLKPQMRFILMDSVLKCDINYNKSREIFRKRAGSYLLWVFFLIFLIILNLLLIAGIIFLIFRMCSPQQSLAAIINMDFKPEQIIKIMLLTMITLSLNALLTTPVTIYIMLIDNIAVTSMMKMPEGTSVFKAVKTFNPLFIKYWQELLWFVLGMLITGIAVGTIVSVSTSIFIVPLSFASGFIMVFTAKYPLISIILNLLMFLFLFALFCLIYPIIGTFTASFQMAYISRVFPGFEILLTAEKDNYGKITASKTMYDIEKEEEKRPAEEREIMENSKN